MATRQQRIAFTIKRFKGFWNIFKKSKSGILGIIIIALFCIVAVFAPFIAPWDPIKPMYGIGEYGAMGAGLGIPISAPLAKPIWYEDLVPLGIIHTGLNNVTESFFNVVNTYQTGGSRTTVQLFAHEGDINATDDGLNLNSRVTKIIYVNVTENGATQTLQNGLQYRVDPVQPRIVNILDYYPNYTIFKVTYSTGSDLVENIEVVKDHMFNSPDSLNVWDAQSNGTSTANISYNNESGLILASGQKPGCMDISYVIDNSYKNESVAITLLTNFTYPYIEPPDRFTMYTSIKAQGINTTERIPVNYFFYDANRSIKTSNTTLTGNASYTSSAIYSTDPLVMESVGINPSPDGIFTHSGTYQYVIQIVIPTSVLNANPNKTLHFYLDDVDCWVYGNVFGLLGTDWAVGYPRDLFSSLVYGSRVSLIVGILSAVFSTLIGLFLGLVSGYIGGIVDEGIMRFADLLLVLPTLPLFIVLIVAMKKVSGIVSIWNIIIILTLLGWMGFARSVRSMVLSIRERAFIEAAKAAGAGKLHIINRHVIPNVFALVYITLATSVPGAIITEASLSWLGLGDPLIASWGKTLYDFNNSSVATSAGITEYWFWVFPSCIAIALLATAFILVGYALDEILNPRLRERR